jgi:hypothetical protein
MHTLVFIDGPTFLTLTADPVSTINIHFEPFHRSYGLKELFASALVIFMMSADDLDAGESLCDEQDHGTSDGSSKPSKAAKNHKGRRQMDDE